MHIDQGREPGPPDSGKPEPCGRKGAPAICSDTQTTFPSIRAASAWADPAGRHGKRPVICIETGEAFPNAAAASKHAGCSRQTIGNCAAGRSRTAGGYHWAYAEQPPESWRAAIECPEAGVKFESLGDAAEWAGCEAAEIADCLAGRKDEAGGVRWRFRKLRGGRRSMSIVCVETGDEFPSIKAAEKWAGCCHGTISAVLSDRRKTAGGHRWACRATGAELEDPCGLPRPADDVSRGQGSRRMGGLQPRMHQRRAGRTREYGGRTPMGRRRGRCGLGRGR